jgi:hypothetical protein
MLDGLAMDRYLSILVSLILIYIYTDVLLYLMLLNGLATDRLFLKYKLCKLSLQFREAVERQDVFLWTRPKGQEGYIYTNMPPSSYTGAINHEPAVSSSF